MGVLLALLSSAVWGTSDYFGGVLAKRSTAMSVVLVTQTLSAVGLTALLFVADGWDWTPELLLWGVAAGVTGPAGLISFYHALAVGRMGVVSPIAATGIAVPVVVGLIQGEQPSVVQLVGLAVAALGVVLVSGPDVRPDIEADQSARQWVPVAMALFSALCFGLWYVILDAGAAVGDEPSVLMLLTLQRVTTVALLAVPVLVVSGVHGLGRRQAPALLLISFGDAAANGLYALSSTYGLLSVTAALASMYPVATVALARVLLHERLSRLQSIGFAVALSGVVLLAMGPS